MNLNRCMLLRQSQQRERRIVFKSCSGPGLAPACVRQSDSFESEANFPFEFDVTEAPKLPKAGLAEPDRSRLFARGLSTPAEQTRPRQLIVFAFLCEWTPHTSVFLIANQAHLHIVV